VTEAVSSFVLATTRLPEWHRRRRKSEPSMKQPSARSALILRRIAETLEVPLETFAQGAEQSEMALAQSATLLRAFVKIEDPEVRKRCLAFVEQAAATSTSQPP
jgi:hypothetical protein